MTQFTLSAATQNAINLAVSQGPGTNNANYLAAYNDIYNDLVANGNVNPAVVYWFSQAGSINSAQFSSTPSASSTYIWAYTIAAAASEGATITIPNMQAASNDLARNVFETLQNSQFSFNDTGNFSPTSIVANDAGTAIRDLKADAPNANLDFAIWGGTLFATTELGDPTYFSDNNVGLTPGSRDASAVLSGWAAGSIAVLAAGGNTLSTGLSNIGNLDSSSLSQALGPAGLTASLTIGALGGTLALAESQGIVAALLADYAMNGHLESVGTAQALLKNNATEMGLAFSSLTSGLSSFFGRLTSSFNSSWGTTFSVPLNGSPIILDLTGNGVQTTSENSGTYFDLRNTGFAEKTGWVAPQDGLLVFDPSAGPVTDGNQLFGNYTTMPNGTIAPNGFAALAALATTNATSLNATTSLIDPKTGVAYFNELRVWQDANGNGVVDPGELKSLSSLGIQSLNLGYTDQGTSVMDAAGNNPEFVGSFTYTNNTQAAMDDVNFANDTSQTVPLSWVATTPAIDTLPDLSEMGTMYSLHEAMARDTTGTLQNLVTQFVNDTTIASRNATLEQLLIFWGGAENVNPNSRNSNGGNFDAQHLVVLESAMGRGFNQPYQPTNPGDPVPDSVPELTNDYSYLFERVYAELAAQTFLKTYYNEITTTTGSNGTTYNFSAVLTDLFAHASSDTITEFYRTIFASGIPDAQMNYAGLLSSLATNAPSLVSTVNAIVAPYYNPNLADGAGGNLITAPGGGSTLVGGLGNDTIIVNNGNNVVYGNAGNKNITINGYGVDQVYGGTGSDTFNIGSMGSGSLLIGGAAGSNTFNLNAVDPGIILTGGASDTLVAGANDITGLTVNGIPTVNVAGGTLKINTNQFSGFNSFINSGGGNATLYGMSAGTYSLAGKTVTGNFDLSAANTSANVTLVGNNQNGQTLTGGTGNNTLQAGNGTGDVLQAYSSGNETLKAGSGGDSLYDGSGVDTLTGGTGNDTFYINSATTGTTVTGGGGSDTLIAGASDITGLTISGISALNVAGGTLRINASQLGAFSTLINNGGGNGAFYAMAAGTYSLAGKTVTGNFNLSAQNTSANVTLTGNSQAGQTLYGGSGTDILNAGNGVGDILYAGSGANTLKAGTGGDSLYDSSGVDTLTGGTGNDTFYINSATTGTTVTGGGGSDTLVANASNITGLTISGVLTLNVAAGTEMLTASQFSGFSSLVSGPWTTTLYVANAGTYSLAAKTVTGSFTLSAQNTSANVTLTGNGQVGQTLYGGSGTDTLNAGNGVGDILYAGSGANTLKAGTGGDSLYDSSGVDTLTGGTGNDTFYINSATTGTTVTGGGGSDTLVDGHGDISNITVSGVQKVQDNSFGSIKLTASQIGGFSTLVNNTGGSDILYATTTGAYSLSGKTITGLFNLSASQTANSVTLTGSNQAAQTLTGGTGVDTLTAGSGAGDILYGGSGNTTMNAGTGNDTLDGGSGINTYDFGTAFGQDVVNNAYGGNSTAKGTLNFASGITDEKLWLQRSGNDLLIDLLGTHDQIDVSGWFGSNAGAQVQEITAGGLKLDTQVAQLVQAMATYQTAHSSFNPQATGTTMPTDTALQNAITAAWHT